MSNIKKITLFSSGLTGLLSLSMIIFVVIYAFANHTVIKIGLSWPLIIPLLISAAVFIWGYFSLDE